MISGADDNIQYDTNQLRLCLIDCCEFYHWDYVRPSAQFQLQWFFIFHFKCFNDYKLFIYVHCKTTSFWPLIFGVDID